MAPVVAHPIRADLIGDRLGRGKDNLVLPPTLFGGVMTTIYKCTAPACGFVGTVEAMWLPSHEAMAVAAGGKPVAPANFADHTLCGKHGHQLRKTGVKVFRLAASLAWEAKRAERRAAKRNWDAFAGRYSSKGTGPKQNAPLRRLAPDGRNVNGGLGALSKLDAAKRKAKEKAKADPNTDHPGTA